MNTRPYPVWNKNYVHHQKPGLATVLKEMVFGAQDGMVSTLGSITGIAIGSQSLSTTVLAGIVIISVESISMGIGSYLSNVSEEEMNARKIDEEKEELAKYPEEEKKELFGMYIRDGWSESLAVQMSDYASANKKVILKEMALRELEIHHEKESVSLKGGVYMFFAYIVGGLVPLFSYFFLPIPLAMPSSIIITLIGLFALGLAITKYTKQSLLRSGGRMLVLGGFALLAGLLAGMVVSK